EWLVFLARTPDYPDDMQAYRRSVCRFSLYWQGRPGMTTKPDGQAAARRVNAAHFDVLLRSWSRITPPMRPGPEVAPAIATEIAGVKKRALLLGVTPEFADLADQMVALDINPAMVGAVWPGDTKTRQALVGDWLRAPFAP